MTGFIILISTIDCCVRINRKFDGLLNGDFSHRYLDSDCINFKSFVFRAIYWSIWTWLHNTDIKVQQFFWNRVSTISGGSRGGRNRGAPPLNYNRLCLCIPLCIRMLCNKAQIARERASKTLQLPGPMTPVIKGNRGLDVRHNLLRPLYFKNPGSALDNVKQCL